GVPIAARGSADRNRTSPMPFTDNRFEFRMPGAGSHQFLPLTVLFSTVGDVLDEVTDKISPLFEGASDTSKEEILRRTLQDLYREAEDVIFEGDAYSEEWRREARRRGLPEAEDAVTAYAAFDSPATRELFARRRVMNNEELAAFSQSIKSTYVDKATIEAE